MNAAARTLSQGNFFRGDLMSMTMSKKSGFLFVLWACVIMSALTIIYMRHVERQFYNEMQTIARKNNQANLEQGQLLLEHSMWTSPSRIQSVASKQLNMKLAKPEALIVIKRVRSSTVLGEDNVGASSDTVNQENKVGGFRDNSRHSGPSIDSM
jgi:cell division protein FtsL